MTKSRVAFRHPAGVVGQGGRRLSQQRRAAGATRSIAIIAGPFSTEARAAGTTRSGRGRGSGRRTPRPECHPATAPRSTAARPCQRYRVAGSESDGIPRPGRRCRAAADEARELARHLRLGEHVRLHPAAVRAGVAGEIDQHGLVAGRRAGERRVVVVDDPGELAAVTAAEVAGRQERLELAEPPAGEAGLSQESATRAAATVDPARPARPRSLGARPSRSRPPDRARAGRQSRSRAR